MEALGSNLEFAEATVELLFLRALTKRPDPFRVIYWDAVAQNNGGESLSHCRLAVEVAGKVLEATAVGNGPVNAVRSGPKGSAERKIWDQVLSEPDRLQSQGDRLRVSNSGTNRGLHRLQRQTQNVDNCRLLN